MKEIVTYKCGLIDTLLHSKTIPSVQRKRVLRLQDKILRAYRCHEVHAIKRWVADAVPTRRVNWWRFSPSARNNPLECLWRRSHHDRESYE